MQKSEYSAFIIPTSTFMKRLIVLISGNGSNLQAILDACATGELPASVVCVISNKADAYGLIRAKNAGVEAVHFAKLTTETRQEYDQRLADYVTAKQPDYILLAGWMRILSSSFLSSFPNKVINLHPALPDTFPGTHAIERAFEAYQRGEIDHTGVMVHLVPDEGVDNGPVLATEVASINKDDTLETLEARVHQTEHVLLVSKPKKILEEKVTRYESMLRKALSAYEVASREDSHLRKVADDFSTMAGSYYSDGKYFLEQGDLVNALACFSYGHAWLDAGVKLGVFLASDENLFTI